MKRERVTNLYSGHVQGVGFRYAVRTLTTGFEVTGTVRNLEDGRVELVAEGAQRGIGGLSGSHPRVGSGPLYPAGTVTQWSEAKNEFRGFEITH